MWSQQAMWSLHSTSKTNINAANAPVIDFFLYIYR